MTLYALVVSGSGRIVVEEHTKSGAKSGVEPSVKDGQRAQMESTVV